MEDSLLWRAFPSGYLAVRGVLTVGGWQCVYAGPSHEGLGDEHRVLEGVSHSVWRYLPNWEIGVTLPGGSWTNRTGADMGMLPERFCEVGDMLPDYEDPLTAYAMRQEMMRLMGFSRSVLKPLLTGEQVLEKIIRGHEEGRT